MTPPLASCRIPKDGTMMMSKPQKARILMPLASLLSQSKVLTISHRIPIPILDSLPPVQQPQYPSVDPHRAMEVMIAAAKE